jgi:hypothetical protein
VSSEYGLFIGWNRTRTGRENVADSAYQDHYDFWEKQKKAGKITSHDWVVLTPHGGDINGFVLIRGEKEAIDELAWDKEFLEIIARGELSAEGVAVLPAIVGDAARRQIENLHRLASKVSK